MSNLITIRDIFKRYNSGENEVRALDGISLQIEAGEWVTIVGRSGSGKSTLMNILGCLDSPTEGEYLLEGEDVARFGERKLAEVRNRRIGFIFQGFNLVAGLSALENAELPLLYRGVPKAKRRALAAAALEAVGLGARMHHLPGQMSGGQQQRVAIARAVAAKPPVILADEPTGNLDSGSGKEVMEILHGMNREGRTIILITHDANIAAGAGRLVSLRDGRIEDLRKN